MIVFSTCYQRFLTLNKLPRLKVLISLVCIIFNLLSSKVYADFQVRSIYRPCEPYGDINVVPYYDAVERKTYDPNSGVLVVDVIEHEIMRFYGRLAVNGMQFKIDKISNQSPGLGLSALATGFISSPNATQNAIGLELAIGVVYDPNIRSELEYLVNRNFHYSSSPVLTGVGVPAVAFGSEIKNNVLLINFYYDFSGFEGFRPYVVAGVGGGANDAYSVGVPTPPGGGELVKRHVCLAWNLGAGFRFKFMPRWYLDLKYRYTHLGLAKMETNSIKLRGDYSMNGVSLGLMYIF